MKQNLGALKPRLASHLEGHAAVCRLSWYELPSRTYFTHETNEVDRTKNILFARLGKKYYNINNLEHIKLCLTAEIELTDDNFIILSGYGILSTKNNIDWDWGVVHTTDLCLLVGKDF